MPIKKLNLPIVEVEGYEDKKTKINSLRIRTESKLPERICDNEEEWKSLWRGLKSERLNILKKERLLQHAKNEGLNTPNLQ